MIQTERVGVALGGVGGNKGRKREAQSFLKRPADRRNVAISD